MTAARRLSERRTRFCGSPLVVSANNAVSRWMRTFHADHVVPFAVRAHERSRHAGTMPAVQSKEGGEDMPLRKHQLSLHEFAQTTFCGTRTHTIIAD